MSAMDLEETPIEGVLLIKPKIFSDARGFFTETFSLRTFQTLPGCSEVSFVQDNHSQSRRGVLRGLHYQHQRQQGKLVRVLQGAIWDVCVDLRPKSKSFGKWFGVNLDAESHQQIWIPAGFAHGFVALSAVADVAYKATDYYAPEFEECIRWDDEDLAIKWPDLDMQFNVSEKDRAGSPLKMARLPE